MDLDALHLLQMPEQQFLCSEADQSYSGGKATHSQLHTLRGSETIISESYFPHHVPIQANVSTLMPLSHTSGFDPMWCTDLITDGFDVSEHYDVPWTSETARPLRSTYDHTRLVTPEGASGNAAQPFEPPSAINALGCANPLQPPTNNWIDLTEVPVGTREHHQRHAKKRVRFAAPAPDFTAASSAACLPSENATDPSSIVPATYPSKPPHRATPRQNPRLYEAPSATELSKAGGDNAGCQQQRQKEKQNEGRKKTKNKGKQKMARASAKVTPYQQHVMELLMVIKRECH